MDSNETISSFLKFKSQTFVGFKHHLKIFLLNLVEAEWKRFYPLSLSYIIFSKPKEKSGEVCLYLLQSAGNNFLYFCKVSCAQL